MKVEVLKETENEMEIAVDNLTIASVLARYLMSDERVEFAAFDQEHPLKDEVRVYVRTKGVSPRDVVKENIKRILSDVKDLKESLTSLL